MEYALFGEKIIQRENADHEWEDVPLAEVPAVAAKMATDGAVLAAERYTSQGFSARIIRAPENIVIGEKLGLTADELAERLNDPNDNDGTRARVPEKDFDAMMDKLGLTGEEARARFKGTHWQKG